MLRPIAASAKKIASGPNAACPPLRKIPPQSMSADPFCATEDALRAHKEDEDQDREGAHVLELGGDPHRRDVHEETDDEAAEQRAVGRAEAAEGDGGEQQEQQTG